MAMTSMQSSLNKRHKPDIGMNSGAPPDGSMAPGHGPMPPQQRYQQHSYSGGPPPMQQSGYMGWQAGQYGGHPPPPHSWQGGQHPSQMYSQRGGPPMTPERGGNWNNFRGPPPHQPPQPGGKSQPRRNMKQNGKSNKSAGPDNGQMPQQQYGGWQGGNPNPQWGHQPQWGGPQVPWQGGPPPQMHQPPGYGSQNGWQGSSGTPPRRGPNGPRASPDVMGNGMMGPRSYPPPNGGCQPVGLDGGPDNNSDMYGSSRGMGMDDDASNSTGKHDRDKGRGSYKCGRCGVPKKGHVCPYQPKIKRRQGDPLPTMKGAAIQVEMDEFMTLRRLNIKIQGYPESYATDPNDTPDMVGAERAPPMTVGSKGTPSRSGILSLSDPGQPGQLGSLGDQPRASPIQSPLRRSPINDVPMMAEIASARS